MAGEKGNYREHLYSVSVCFMTFEKQTAPATLVQDKTLNDNYTVFFAMAMAGFPQLLVRGSSFGLLGRPIQT